MIDLTESITNAQIATALVLIVIFLAILTDRIKFKRPAKRR